MNKQKVVLVALRLSIGFMFLWAFVDKTFGLGFATVPAKAWIHGGSPTSGFLLNAAKGPFVNIFHSLASMPVVDWVFMAGLLFVGVTLILNRFVRWGCAAGALMLLFMYLALLWPENNPLLDEHIIYILALMLIGLKSEN
jgi:thiosulfate dehydrogenase [quinone] large subunit